VATINTPDGTLEVASYQRRAEAGLVDYAVVMVILGTLDRAASQRVGDEAWFPLLRLAVWLAGLLLYLGVIRKSVSPGNALLGLRRYSLFEIQGYEGKGSVVCVRNQ
jgi:hypothetical protein